MVVFSSVFFWSFALSVVISNRISKFSDHFQQAFQLNLFQLNLLNKQKLSIFFKTLVHQWWTKKTFRKEWILLTSTKPVDTKAGNAILFSFYFGGKKADLVSCSSEMNKLFYSFHLLVHQDQTKAKNPYCHLFPLFAGKNSGLCCYCCCSSVMNQEKN